MTNEPNHTEAVADYLRDVGARPDDAIDIGATALALAALDRPEAPLDRYRDHLRDLADTLCRTASGASLDDRIAALTEVMATRFDYQGDALTYDDLQNANLIRVIDRRKGLPVALGILYIHAGRAQGWTVDGLNFPGHFLIRVGSRRERAVIDPFHGGRRVGAHDMRDLLKRMGASRELQSDDYAVASNRSILLRLQNNIKQRALAANDTGRAASVLGSMLLLAPLHGGAWRELGLVLAQLGNLQDAARATERAIELSDEAGDKHDALAFLRQLRQRLN